MPGISIPIVPIPKPRMTRSDVWKQRPPVVRYWRYKDELRAQVSGSLGPRISVVFRVPMPKSWSKKEKERMNGKPHQSKPDADNYLKAFMDALCVDDSYIYDARVQKYWAEEGSIEIEELGE